MGQNLPIGAHFEAERTSRVSEECLRRYRAQSEGMDASEVVWFPYDLAAIEEVSMYRGTIQIGPCIEPYHPDRVARQFGRVQQIPVEPIRPLRL